MVSELQRIIALEEKPSDDVEAVVYEHFRWLKVFFDAVFMGDDELTNSVEELLTAAGVDVEAVPKSFHSFNWRSRSIDGDPIAAGIVDWQHGIKKVTVKYAPDKGKHSVKTVALCMYFPVLREVTEGSTAGVRAKDRKKPEVLRMPNGNAVQLAGQTVHMQPFVLTMPRMEMLMRLLQVSDDPGGIGLQLMGVHGAGKSHMLEAIASILTCGPKCDLVWLRAAKELTAGPSALLSNIAPSGGDLSKLVHMAASPTCVEDLQQESTPNSDAMLASLDFMSRSFKSIDNKRNEEGATLLRMLLDVMDSCPRPGHLRVVILDEVNGLLKQLQKDLNREYPWHWASGKHDTAASSIAECLEVWLEWKYGSPERVLRVLSASPHGAREHVSGLFNDPRFELRPPRADHLAAVMCVAPEYLLKQPQDPNVQAPPLALPDALTVCEQLGSNMRYSTRCVQRIASGLLMASALANTQDEMVVELANRLQRELSDAKKKYTEDEQIEVPGVVWQACLQDASLTVREEHSPVSRRLLAGVPSIKAACNALEQLVSYDQVAPEFVEALRQVLGTDFEAQCTGRVYLNLFALSAKRLPVPGDQGDADDPLGLQPVGLWQAGPLMRGNRAKLQPQHLPQAGAADQSAVDGRSSAHPEPESGSGGVHAVRARKSDALHFFVAGAGAAATVVPEPMVAACHKLLGADGSQRAVYQTPHHFANFDIVELQRDGSKILVRLYETTVSDIKTHADKKSRMQVQLPVPVRTEVDVAVPKSAKSGKSKKPDKPPEVQLSCTPVWGDILASCGTPKHTAKLLADGSVKHTARQSMLLADMEADKHVGDLNSGTSKVNVLLASLGVPLVVERSIETRDKESSKFIPAIQVNVKHSDALCRQLFHDESDGTVRVPWQVPGITSWELEVVYGTNTPEAQNAGALVGLDASATRMSAPFVRYVFFEQLQEVLPV